MSASVLTSQSHVHFYMPAEWEEHEATWISWPRPEGISFPGRYREVIPTFIDMAKAIGSSEILRINVADQEQEKRIRSELQALIPKEHLEFYPVPTQEPWCRDHGPMFVRTSSTSLTSQNSLTILDWNYNAWGGKYLPYELDDAVPSAIAKLLHLPYLKPNIVLEGGSIDVNGAGLLLTTRSCLLNRNRNPHLTQEQIEEKLRLYLGANHILWLDEGIEGDDTDGHIDDITRFVDKETVVTVLEKNPHDPNYLPLEKNAYDLRKFSLPSGKSLQVIELPMPPRLERDGQRLPASYANFYIGNTVVLLPIFRASSDWIAIDTLASLFPTRRIIPIDSRELIWGLGAFHCLTQQQPIC